MIDGIIQNMISDDETKQAAKSVFDSFSRDDDSGHPIYEFVRDNFK